MLVWHFLSLISFISKGWENVSYQTACPTWTLCVEPSLLKLALDSVRYSPSSSLTRHMVRMVNLQQGAIKLQSCCQTILLWAVRVTQRCSRYPHGMRCEGVGYTSSRKVLLLSVSHLEFLYQIWSSSNNRENVCNHKIEKYSLLERALGWQLRKSGRGSWFSPCHGSG